MSKNENKDKDLYKKGGAKAKGFAANPEAINRAGRKKGSRNKSTLLQAQLQLDGISLEAVDVLQALMRNDKEALGLSEKENVPLSLRLTAAKEALNKAVANEKDKESGSEGNKKGSGEGDGDDDIPLFSSVPVKSA